MNDYSVAAIIPSWDDPKGLVRAFEQESFYNRVSEFLVVEGRFAGRTDKPEYPTKVIEEICNSYDKVTYKYLPDVKQIEKRNWYWNWAEKKNYDFVIVHDTDEFCQVTDEVSFNEDLHMAYTEYKHPCFPIYQDYGKEVTVSAPRPRLFKGPYTYRHKQNPTTISHGSIYSDYGLGKQEIIGTMYQWFDRPEHPNKVGLRGILMHHSKEFRSEERVKNDYIYYHNNPTR